MDKKQRLVRLLEECIKLEEEAIPLYEQHLEDTAFFEEFPAEDVTRVKKALMTLARDSQSHKWVFESLLAKIKEGQGNGQ